MHCKLGNVSRVNICMNMIVVKSVQHLIGKEQRNLVKRT